MSLAVSAFLGGWLGSQPPAHIPPAHKLLVALLNVAILLGRAFLLCWRTGDHRPYIFLALHGALPFSGLYVVVAGLEHVGGLRTAAAKFAAKADLQPSEC